MLTTSESMSGGFQHADPLAQISKVFYDRLDRFQLSKVCIELGLRHKPGETHEVLVKLIGMSVEMRRVKMAQVEAAARKVLQAQVDMIDASRGTLDDDDAFGALFEKPAAAPTPAAAPPASDEVLDFAVLTIADKRTKLTEMGVKYARDDDGKALLALFREAMKI